MWEEACPWLCFHRHWLITCEKRAQLPPSHPPQHFWLRSISYIYLSLVFINERWSPSVHEVFWSDELGKFLLILDEVFLSPSSREPLLECLSYAEHTEVGCQIPWELGDRWV